MTPLQYCILVLGLVVLCSVAAAETPVADFSASPTTGTEPLSVTFTDTSTNTPTSWIWTYRNATTGWILFDTSQNPTFTFPAGSYDINLIVTNDDGSDTKTITDNILVSVAPPVAGFSATPTSGTEPLSVTFTDSSTSTPNAWTWAYRNATTGWTLFSNDQNPTFTFPTGIYDINLTAGNSAGSNDEVRVSYITVSPPVLTPDAEFSGTPVSGDAPLLVTFTDSSTNSPNAWTWAYRNATTGWTQFSNDQNPTFTFPTGIYDINLTAGNKAGSNDEVRVSYITVAPPVLTPDAEFSGTPVSGDAPLLVTFTDSSTNSPDSWTWAYRNATTAWTLFSNDQNPAFTFPAGTYDINLTATNAGGSDDEIKTGLLTVTVPLPVAAFTASPVSGTEPLTVRFSDLSTNSPTSWDWSFGDGSLVNATQQHPVHTYAAAGSYTVSLNVTNAAGSSLLTRTKYISVTSGIPSTPEADFTGLPVSGGVPLTVLFTDLSINQPTGWAWFFGDETYAQPWTLRNASSGWTARGGHSTVVLPDGSIVLMGGYDSGYKNDVWRSTDNGATWGQMNASADWTARYDHTSVTLPDGSIVLMGGYENGGYKNDVWRSTDKGASWTLMTAGANWPARRLATSVVMPDGSIVLMGGYASAYKNDVWRSADKGASWTRVTAAANWSIRSEQASVVMPDGSIVLMGGIYSTTFKNDVWRSTDSGATWTQMNASAGWAARKHPSCVAMPDGSIVLMSGSSSAGYKNDVWRSTDNGAMWTQLTASAEWTPRIYPSSVAMPDGSIVLTGGKYTPTYKGDTWRFQPVGSSLQNPTHTYTATGTYNVTLQAYNSLGYDSSRKVRYVTLSDLPALTDRISIYKDGSWYIDMNGDGVWDAGDQNYGFGAPLWTPVAGDWNNDGNTEIGVYRDGAWYLDYDASGWWSAGDRNFGYGAPGWTPVVGDWNGDGSDKIGAYLDGAWYLDYDGSGTWDSGDKNFAFGGAGWEPVIGKWTDGTSKIGVYKDGVYYIDYSGDYAYNAGDRTIMYGTAGSTAVTGDWNSDGLTEVGTKTGSAWMLDYDGLGAVNASTKSYTFGAGGWSPVTGDWNADGKDKIGIYLDGAWYLDANGNGAWDAGTDRNFAFGTSGWIPVVGKWS